MAGDVLDHAHRAARFEPVEHGAAERRHLHRLGAQGAVADHVVRAFLADIEQRQTIDVDPGLGEHHRQRLGIDPRRLDRRNRRFGVELGEAPTGREFGPFGRLQPRHPAAFLVDQDRQIVATGEIAQAVGQRLQLPRSAQLRANNMARRIRRAKQGTLIVGKGEAGKTEDRGKHAPS